MDSKKTSCVQGKDYENNKVRTKKYPDGSALLTNDCGTWCHLSKKEYEKYLFKDFSKELYQKLIDSYMIITDDNIGKASHQISDYYWYVGKGTSLHIIVPTLRCNYTCKYCYAYRAPEDATGRDMTEETMDKTIDFIFQTPTDEYNIEFTGGEPLLKYSLIKRGIFRAEKIAKEQNKKVLFSIVTNGTFLEQSMVDFFKKHEVGVCLSLDGPKEIHDKNRRITKGNRPTHNIVIEKLELLKKNRYPSISAIPVILKDSLNAWKEIVDEYVGLGLTVLRFKYVSRFGFASDAWKSMSYSAEEYLDSWRKTIDYMLELNKKGIQISENLASLMIFKLTQGINTNYSELMIPCGAVTGQLAYNHDGSIYTCDEARTFPEFKIGTVFDSTYHDLLNNPISKSMHSVSNLTAQNCDDDCAWFAFCGLCPLEIYNEEKGFITNVPSNYRHKIHEGMFEFLMQKLLYDPEAKKYLERWPFFKLGLIVSSKESKDYYNPFEGL